MTEHATAIDAPAITVYKLVADPLRMPQWSPECARCRWTAGADRAEVGARFRGTSRNRWRRCSTTSTIIDMHPSQLFAWEVTYFRLPVARWEYRVEPAETGVRLVEAVEDRRGWLLQRLSPLITGSPDRAKRNADTMAATLLAIKAAAESEQTTSPNLRRVSANAAIRPSRSANT